MGSSLKKEKKRKHKSKHKKKTKKENKAPEIKTEKVKKPKAPKKSALQKLLPKQSIPTDEFLASHSSESPVVESRPSISSKLRKRNSSSPDLSQASLTSEFLESLTGLTRSPLICKQRSLLRDFLVFDQDMPQATNHEFKPYTHHMQTNCTQIKKDPDEPRPIEVAPLTKLCLPKHLKKTQIEAEQIEKSVKIFTKTLSSCGYECKENKLF